MTPKSAPHFEPYLVLVSIQEIRCQANPVEAAEAGKLMETVRRALDFGANSKSVCREVGVRPENWDCLHFSGRALQFLYGPETSLVWLECFKGKYGDVLFEGTWIPSCLYSSATFAKSWATRG